MNARLVFAHQLLIFQAMRLILLCVWLVGSTGAAQIPHLLAWRKIEAPTHGIPVGGGTSYHNGWLEATEDHLVAHHQFDPETGILSGKVEVFDRITLAKQGEIRPEHPVAGSRWGTSRALFGNLLALCGSAGDTPNPVEVYDLRTRELLYILAPPAGANGTGFGEQLTTAGDFLLLHEAGNDDLAPDAGAIHIHRFSTGEPMGTVSPGEAEGYFGWGGLEISSDGRFLLHRREISYHSAGNRYYAIDLHASGTLHALHALAFLNPDRTGLEIEFHGRHLILQERGIESPSVHFYDLSSGEVLWSLPDPAGDWYLTAADGERLFVRDPGHENGRVLVHDIASDVLLDELGPPAGGTHQWFGNRIWLVDGLLFVSSSAAWFVYDPRTLELLHTIDSQGWFLSSAEVVPVTGSSLFAVVFPTHPGPLSNAYHYNPQAMIMDLESGALTHRLDLEQRILTNGWQPPRFGRKIFASGKAGVAVLRPGYDGEYGQFSLVPSVSSVNQRMVASVTFENLPGHRIDLQRLDPGGEVEEVASFTASTDSTTFDVPFGDHQAAISYQIFRRQLAHHVDDYEISTGELMNDILANAADLEASGGLLVVGVPSHGQPSPNAGALFCFDIESRQLVRTIQPDDLAAEDRFGSKFSVDDGRVAVTSGRKTYVFDLHSGTLLHDFPPCAEVVLSGEHLIRSYNTRERIDGHWFYVGQIAVDDLETGTHLHTTPTGYRSPLSYGTTRIAAGTDHLLLGLNVHDLRAGTFLHSLVSPSPAADDGFGYRIAADNSVAAVAAYGQGAIYLFDLASANHLRTLQVHDRPDGFANYATSGTALVLDVDSGMLAWTAKDSLADTPAGIHVFDLATGREIKIESPVEEVIFNPWPSGGREPVVDQRAVYALGEALAIADGTVLFLQNGGFRQGGTSIGSLDTSPLRATPLAEDVLPLVLTAWFEIAATTRRDTTYQVLAGPRPDELLPFAEPFQGTGQIIARRVPAGSAGFAGFRMEWSHSN